MGKACCECGKEKSPYKCPACREPYCSVDCWKSHKTRNCELSRPQEKNDIEEVEGAVRYEFPTEDTVPIEKLRQLRDSKDLKECLKNPHVKNIMRAILADKNPTKAIALAMTEPIFVEVADACLKVVESQ